MRTATQRTLALATTVALCIATVSCGEPVNAPSRLPGEASLERSSGASKPAIVLVHGAFADGSAWTEVMRRLQRDGYRVSAVQNSLHSLAGDISSTQRVIDAESGPVIVVGHSYGGAVITGAAAGRTNVKALVYIAAFAPEAGEVFGSLVGKYGPSSLDAALRPNAAGFLYIDRAAYHDVFAGDLPNAETDVMAVAQTPVHQTVFGESVPAAAWRTIPSWYLVAKSDRTIQPRLERFMADRMGAHTVEIESSHVAFISHPEAVVQLIEEAAHAKSSTAVTNGLPTVRRPLGHSRTSATTAATNYLTTNGPS